MLAAAATAKALWQGFPTHCRFLGHIQPTGPGLHLGKQGRSIGPGLCCRVSLYRLARLEVGAILELASSLWRAVLEVRRCVRAQQCWVGFLERRPVSVDERRCWCPLVHGCRLGRGGVGGVGVGDGLMGGFMWGLMFAGMGGSCC